MGTNHNKLPTLTCPVQKHPFGADCTTGGASMLPGVSMMGFGATLAHPGS